MPDAATLTQLEQAVIDAYAELSGAWLARPVDQQRVIAARQGLTDARAAWEAAGDA